MPSSEPKATRQPVQEENLWNRISGGNRIDELWSQLSADTRATYTFYGKEVDWEQINKLPWWHRPLHIAKGMFLAMFYKLTAPRRIMLLIAIPPLRSRLASMGIASSGKFPRLTFRDTRGGGDVRQPG